MPSLRLQPPPRLLTHVLDARARRGCRQFGFGTLLAAAAAGLRTVFMAGLLALAVLVASAPARADGFDRQASTQRYLQWLNDFERDFRRLRSVPQATTADVERIFAETLVPGSRAVVLVRELNALRQKDLSNRSGGLLIALMRGAVVAGDGGLYTDTPPDLEPKRLRVWYLHVAGGEQLERYFADPEVFKPYRLPENGVFERDVYPFLLFEDGPRLRLGAVPREFWNILRFLENLPYA
ncbi:hypothetical protein ACILG0_04955 [Pseudomonadota bacterium AL_CKDN230030165-1A_HGKHYDSX7]